MQFRGAAKRRAFQHTAARRRLGQPSRRRGCLRLFQHTAARRRLGFRHVPAVQKCLFQHTAARRRLEITKAVKATNGMFQHTAARRRLAPCTIRFNRSLIVSTHSRPKAAGGEKTKTGNLNTCFNTQPPEGGWSLSQKPCSIRFRSPDFAKLPRKARTRV